MVDIVIGPGDTPHAMVVNSDGSINVAGGTGGGPITAPLGQTTDANSVAVTLSTDQTDVVSGTESVKVVVINPADGTYLSYASPSTVAGPTASGATITAAPVTAGGRAATTNPTAVTDGQVVNAMFDKEGKQISVSAIRTLKGMQETTITSSTAETTIVTAVASTFNDLYGLTLANSSASATKVTLKDSTSGTTRWVGYVPAGDTRGFMLDPGAALAQATVNTIWTITCGTSVASLDVSAFFVANI